MPARFQGTSSFEGAGNEYSDARIRLALASAQVGVWDWNIQTNRVDWSSEAGSLFGLGPGEFPDSLESVLALIHPEDRDRVVEVIEATLEQPPHEYSVEHRILTASGEVRWLAARGQVHFGPDGGPLHMTGTVTDITARARAEESVRRAEELFRDIVEDQEEMIVRWLPDGTRTFVNRAYCRTFGGTYEDFIGTSFLPLVSEPDRQRVLEKVRSFTPERPIATHVHQSILPDGQLCWQEWTDRARFDSEGRLLELQSVGRDISERVRAQQSLASSEMLLRLFIKHTPAAVAMFDTEMRYLQWSDRWLTDYHLEGQNLLGRSHYDVFPDLPHVWKEVHARVLQGAVERAEEDPFPRSDGSVEWLQWEVRPWHRVDGTIGGVIMFTQVITGRRQMEDALRQSEESLRQAQKMEAIGQLAGGIAHDFNNILAAITLQAHAALLDSTTHPESRQAFEQIGKAADRAAALTRQLLQFGRRQVMHCEWLDLRRIIENVAQMLRRILKVDIELVLDLGSEEQPVFADGVMIDQILMNLALNARDAMPRGGRLSIRLARVELHEADLHAFPEAAPGSFVELSVIDTGDGIAPENLDRVFEPFFTTKVPGQGTGLGLATVFGIVRQHRGALFLHSEPGEGATFRVLLPLGGAAAESRPPGPIPPPARGTRTLHGGQTILVVEDDTAVRSAMRTLLKVGGFRVLDAADAGEAIKTFEEYPEVDLVITDVVIPGGKTGLELSKFFRQARPELPVILTSGYSRDLFGRAIELSANEVFLPKPIDGDQLLALIQERVSGPRGTMG